MKKNHLKNERLNEIFQALSGARFYDCINAIHQYTLNLSLGNKMSSLGDYGALSINVIAV